MDFGHVSVLLEETIESLNIKEDGIYVDGTLGGGGHSLMIARRLSKRGRLIGIDRDDRLFPSGTGAAQECAEGLRVALLITLGDLAGDDDALGRGLLLHLDGDLQFISIVGP